MWVGQCSSYLAMWVVYSDRRDQIKKLSFNYNSFDVPSLASLRANIFPASLSEKK